MILTTHALVGAAIGKSIANPWTIIATSILGHFILDTFKHGEYADLKTNTSDFIKRVSLDFAVFFFVIILYFYIKEPSILETKNALIGIGASVLPDCLNVLYKKFNIKTSLLSKFSNFHKWIHLLRHKEQKNFNIKNNYNDVIFSTLAIIILFLG